MPRRPHNKKPNSDRIDKKPSNLTAENAFCKAENRIQEAAETNAITLNLAFLKLTRIPESIGVLKNVQHILIFGNQLTVLPESTQNLSQLQHLDISDNQFIELPMWLGNLTNLKSLDLSSNKLAVLPDSFSRLTLIRELYVNNNEFTLLPEFLGQLINLECLDASFNKLTMLPESLHFLSKMKKLSVNNNQLTRLPGSLGHLTQLENLNASFNKLSELPDSFEKLLDSTTLHVSGNEILNLLTDVSWQEPANLYNRKTASIPSHLIKQYFRTKRGLRPLNEAKLILVGRGGVGKTSLIKRLFLNTFDKHELETPGIEIKTWPVKLQGGDSVRLHVWDFGGQEILHATHQFFLTEQTLYLLVLSAREGNPTQDAEYWLQLIKSFGGESRVIIALNKSSLHPFDVNRGLLLEKYPFIVDFVKTDCEDAYGKPELMQIILHQTEEMEYRKIDFPRDWFAIKERLACMDENLITWEEYQDICCELGESDIKAQRQLAKCLHILGIALNYSDDLRLQEPHVLNPRWVTEGIYTILRAGQKGNCNGALAKSDLITMLDSKHYPQDTHDFLLRLMEKFQLCFKLPLHLNYFDCWLVPELLNETQPEIKALLEAPGLDFRYQFEVLPEGFLPRFIVQTHLYSEANPLWRWRTVLWFNRNGHHDKINYH